MDWFELPPMPHKGRISSLHSDNGGAQSRICRIAPSKQRKQRLRDEARAVVSRRQVGRRKTTGAERRATKACCRYCRALRDERYRGPACHTTGISSSKQCGRKCDGTRRALLPPRSCEGTMRCANVEVARLRATGEKVSDGLRWNVEGRDCEGGDGEGHEGTRDEAEAEGGERERRRRESGEAWPCESEESLDDLTGEDDGEQGLRVRNGLARGMLGCLGRDAVAKQQGTESGQCDRRPRPWAAAQAAQGRGKREARQARGGRSQESRSDDGSSARCERASACPVEEWARPRAHTGRRCGRWARGGRGWEITHGGIRGSAASSEPGDRKSVV